MVRSLLAAAAPLNPPLDDFYKTVAGISFYALILAFAIHPKLSVQVGLGLSPREAEAILVGLLIVVGVNLAWLGLTESGETAGA